MGSSISNSSFTRRRMNDWTTAATNSGPAATITRCASARRLDMPAMGWLNVGMKPSLLKIGQVADHFGLPTHVLRHWDSVGLLSPARVEGDRRRYTRDDLFRVASIVNAKQAGLSLPDIRAFLAACDPAARKD